MNRRSAGFTLVELLVAIAVIGIVAVVIYQLFNVTSQNFREVDQLADLNDRVRFAMERVRTQIQSAGAQSTPDSLGDPWVAPDIPGGARVAGLIPYNGWQDDRTVLAPDIAAANPNVSYDGIVIMGAVDYPMSFELAGLEGGGGSREGRIYGHYKGVMKLLGQDPFQSGLTQLPTLTGTMAAKLADDWSTRLLRVSDHLGYQQFIQPLDLTGPNGVAPDNYFSVGVPADGATFGPKFRGAAAGSYFGLDDLPEGDTGYDAGLIDAYWIHAVKDPANNRIVSLVRDRLCATTVASNAFAGAWDPNTALASTCGGTDQRVVLASYVADFQIWFDCADLADGAVRAAPWSFEWRTYDHSGGDCMDSAVMKPGYARAAHLRIALHAKNERTNQRHVQFEDAAGAVCTPACDPTRMDAATLRTFDFFPDTKGAARVVVMQSDFELVNFVNRNVID